MLCAVNGLGSGNTRNGRVGITKHHISILLMAYLTRDSCFGVKPSFASARGTLVRLYGTVRYGRPLAEKNCRALHWSKGGR